MICYRLRCAEGHEFEGWFQSSESFDRQNRSLLVSCPECGSTGVGRALMAPAVRTAKRRDAARREHAATPDESGDRTPAARTPSPMPAAAAAPAGMPDALRAMLSRMREAVERNCDYVGPGFAAEATRMHRGETEQRAIYGEATDAERDALADEGVEVTRIPWIPRADG